MLSPCTACGNRMVHRKWKETKLQPGTAGPGNMLGSCLFSFHFLLAILCRQAVQFSIVQICTLIPANLESQIPCCLSIMDFFRDIPLIFLHATLN